MANEILDALNRRLFSGPAMDTYTRDYQKSLSAPTTFDYNIASNKAAGQFIQDRTKDLLGDNLASDILGQAGTYAAVPVSILASPFYETAQVIADKRMEPGSGIKGFYDAFMDERPLSTAIERGAGVLQSTPLGEAIYNLGGKAADLVSGIRNTNIGDFFFAPAGAADFRDGKTLQAPTISIRGDYTRAPNTAFAELLSDPDKFDRSPASSGVRQTIGSRIKEGVGSIFDKVRSVSPTGIISNLLSNLDRFDTLSAADQDFITSQGLGQDKYGYNKRSAFGNYANLVKERAKIAADRRNKGLAQRAIDEYYEKLEKERQARLQTQIQNAINQGRSIQRGYEDTYSSMGYSSPAERAADTPTGTLGRV